MIYDLKAMFETTVKLPSKRIIDEITDFLVYSFLNRNELEIPKHIKKPKYSVDDNVDEFGMIIDKKDLPYGINETVYIIVNSIFDEVPMEASISQPDKTGKLKNTFILEFYPDHKTYQTYTNIETLKHRFRTNVRHEFVHLIQDYLLKGKGLHAQSKGLLMPHDYLSSKWQYLTSPIEYEAYLVTKIDAFVEKHKKGFKSVVHLNDAIRKFVATDAFFKANKKAIDQGMTHRSGFLQGMDDVPDEIEAIVDYPLLRKKAIKRFASAPEIRSLLK